MYFILQKLNVDGNEIFQYYFWKLTIELLISKHILRINF